MICLYSLSISFWIACLVGSLFGVYFFGVGADHTLCLAVFVISFVRVRRWFGFA